MKDYEYIKSRFDQDGESAPESLSEDSVSALLDRVKTQQEEIRPDEEGALQEKERLAAESERQAEKSARMDEVTGQREKRRLTRRRGAVLAVAACLALSLVAYPVIRSSMKTEKGGRTAVFEETEEAGIGSDELTIFTDESQIRALVDDMTEMDSGTVLYKGGDEAVVIEDAEAWAEDTADGPIHATNNKDSAASAGTAEHSETYNQVENVDEADIIKTDGKYIYYVNGYDEIEILRAKEGRTKVIATISQFDEDGTFTDMYLAGDRLMTVGMHDTDKGQESVVCAYDISDRYEPKEIGRFRQSGMVISSRMTGGIVYLVTQDYASRDHYFPCVTQKGEYRDLPADCVCAFPNPDMPHYIVASSVDFKTGEKIDSTTRAVLGASGDIYCNTENLYLTSMEYTGSTEATRILKIALNGGRLKTQAAGKVRGRVYGQWAMDEKDGYFRIATTADKNGRDVNNLYVLDKDLKETGSVTGFARNEHIESVRFIGDRGYVITYEQIDPLFVLDLSDPEDPRIDGEVEITGFSSLLVPISDDRMIGIGYATADNGEGGEMSDGLKLALFDVGNPSEPKVLDAKEYQNMSSEAQTDHHALLQNTGQDYLAIPYEIWEDEDDQTRGGVLAFTAGDKIQIRKNYRIKDEGVRRCVYIGDYVYAVNMNDEFTSFKM